MKKFNFKYISLIFIIFCSVFCVACGHTHSYSTQTVNPTTNTNGYTRHSCSCGEYYDTDYTCLVSFISTCTESGVSASALPNIPAKKVAQNTIFEELDNTNNYTISNYIGISVGQPITNSITVTIVWKPLTQAEKTFSETANKIKKLCELSYDYNPENFILRATQYIRTSKYTGNAWNIMGGTIESDFASYVLANQGNINVSSLLNIDTLTSPKTNETLDFIHMFAVMNGIENTDSVNSAPADVAGWAGDLCTLVQELVNSGETGNNLTTLANQKFNSSNSSFGSNDLIADMDAINIMNAYYNSENKSFAEIIIEYYTNTTSALRKTMFLNTVFGKTYTSVSTMANDIIARIQNNFFASYFCGTLNISLTTHSTQFMAAATAFANYFVN